MSAVPVTRPVPAAATVVDQAGETVVRRFVTVLAVVVGGLCFLFSLGNVYQLAVDLELWVWIRPLVAPAVDLSLVALVVGIRFLARRGISGRELRRPRLFLLAVGLAAWALNTAGAMAERDWGKAAFDSLAPGLLLGWAEVLPWFLRQFHAVTHPAVPADFTGPAPVAAPQPAGNSAAAPAIATGPSQSTTVPALPAEAPPAGTGNGTRANRTPSRPAPIALPRGTGTGERDADGVMRAWWATQRAAGRTPSGAELDRVCGRDPRNGAGRKARARYLREEAAGRFWEPGPVPAAEQGAAVLAPDAAPSPDGGTTTRGAPAVPGARPASPSPAPGVAATAEREPTPPGPAVLGAGTASPAAERLPRSRTAPQRRDPR